MRQTSSFKRRGQSGVSLLELIVATAIVGIVSLAVATIYTTANRYMLQDFNSSNAQSEASFALEHIKKFVQLATAIDNATLPVGGNSNALQFTWTNREPPSTGALVTRTSRYEIQAGNLVFIQDTTVGAAEQLARGVSAIEFTRPLAGSIAVDLTVNVNAVTGTRQQRLQTTVNPRGVA